MYLETVQSMCGIDATKKKFGYIHIYKQVMSIIE